MGIPTSPLPQPPSSSEAESEIQERLADEIES